MRAGRGGGCPVSWRRPPLNGIPIEPVASEWSHLRRVATTAGCQKLYLRALTALYERTATPSPVWNIGFARHMGCREIVEALRRLIRLSNKWAQLEVIIASLDLETFFDTMVHHQLWRAALLEGADPFVVLAMAEQYRDLEGTAQFSNAADEVHLGYERGGRQGGVETPRLFKGPRKASRPGPHGAVEKRGEGRHRVYAGRAGLLAGGSSVGRQPLPCGEVRRRIVPHDPGSYQLNR